MNMNRFCVATAIVAVFMLVGQRLDGQGAVAGDVRVLGIVAKMPRGERSIPVADITPAGWTSDPISPDGTTVSLKPAYAGQQERGRQTARLELGQAWNQANEIVRRGAEFAEVDIEADLPQGESQLPIDVCPPCPIGSVDNYKKGKDPIQGALADAEWSLKGDPGANVEAAWGLFGNPPAGLGSGVVIAHPDTGYTEHPEFYLSTNSSPNNVLPGEGWNYLDNIQDPRDTLLSGLLRNPSHGTKTGSVIISRRGSQFEPQAGRWVSGVAPDAELIPLRVTEGVALAPDDVNRLRISSARLAEAIFDVAAGTLPSKSTKKAQVISISLGGLPSFALQEAIEYAWRENIIVVAAAGNQVRRVVFPGGYTNVMGVAASNFNNRPWKGSSRGSRVKITAPGESVWTAATRSQFTCLQASDGTSFATATTAGIAALWLAHHRDRLPTGPGAVPEAFHNAVTRGFRTVTPWDPKRYGPGIIDALAVLNLVPGTLAESLRSPARWCANNPHGNAAVDALTALLGDGADSEQRAERLFNPTVLCDSGVIAHELATTYGLFDDVARAFDEIASSARPSQGNYRRLRNAVLAKPISAALRAALESANKTDI